MGSEKSSSKMDVVVKLVLVFFIALLSFSVGTFVGKKFSDNQHMLAQLEPSSSHEEFVAEESTAEARAQRDIASVPQEFEGTEPSEKLTDEEIAKLAAEFVTADSDLTQELPSVPARKQDSAPVPTAVRAAASAVKEEVQFKKDPSPAAQRILEGKAPSKDIAKAPERRQPQSLPAQTIGSPVGKFTVQIGSYNNEKEAQTMTADLRTQGYEAFYTPAKVNGQTWYRVSVGLFATQKEAQTFKTSANTPAFEKAIVRKIASE
jgi:cell division protein FtsN